MEKRYIGIDLHRNRFTCCIRLENERMYVREWELADLGKIPPLCGQPVVVDVRIPGG